MNREAAARTRFILPLATLALLGAVLAALATAGTASAQLSAPPEDLSIRFTRESYQNTVGRGIELVVVVQNHRSTPSNGYTIDLEWSRDNGRESGQLIPNFQTHTNRTGAALPGGQSREHRFNWTAQETQDGALTLMATVRTLPGASDTNMNNNFAAVPANVLKPAVEIRASWGEREERQVLPRDYLYLDFLVKNRGNGNDVLQVSLENPAKVRGWGIEFLHETDISLDPQVSFQARVRLQPDERAIAFTEVGGTLEDNPFLRVKSRSNPAIYQDIPIPKIVIGRVQAVNVTAITEEATMTPGQAVVYHFRVENKGNSEDVIHLEVAGAPANETWSRSFAHGENITVAPFSTFVTSVSLTSLPVFPAGTERFDIVVSTLNGAATSQVPVTLITRQVYLLHAGIETPELATSPGHTTSFLLNVTNRGNGNDTMLLSLVSPLPNLDWRYEFEDARPVIPLNTSRLIRLNLTVPAGTPPTPQGERIELRVRIESEGSSFGGNPVNATELRMYGRVPEEARGVLRFTPPANAFVDPGRNLTLPLRVDSVGNRQGSFQIETEVTPNTWTRPEASPAFHTIPVLEGRDATLVVKPPASAKAGDRASVTVRLVSGGTVMSQYTFDVRVSGADLQVTGLRLDPAGELYQGDRVNVTVAVTNVGNLPAGSIIDVTFFRVQGGERSILEKMTIGGGLEPGAVAAPRVMLDTSTLRGPYTLLAVAEGRNLEEMTTDNNEMELPIFVRHYQVHLEAGVNHTAVPGQTVQVLALTLRNVGNHPEPLVVTAHHAGGWIVREQREFHFTLAPEELRILNLTLLVPREPGETRHPITLKVTSAIRPDLNGTASLVLTVKDELPPLLSEAKVAASVVTIADTLNLTVRATDAFGVARVTAQLTYPDRTLVERDLVRIGPDLWMLNTSFQTVGSFNVTLVAEDTSKLTSVLKGPGFRVVAGSKPTIEREDGNRTVISAGTPIRLRIEDPLGIGSVFVTLDNNARNRTELKSPYTIDTSGWGAGERQVKVEARNLYGEETVFGPFKVTVDNTPPKPKVSEIVAGAPDAPVTVRVTLPDKDLENVVAIVTYDGTPVEHPMTLEEDGRYVVTFTPQGKGAYRFNVKATDAAGNLGSLETDTVIHVDDPGLWERLSPAGAIPGTLAALAGVALLAGRRRRA